MQTAGRLFSPQNHQKWVVVATSNVVSVGACYRTRFSLMNRMQKVSARLGVVTLLLWPPSVIVPDNLLLERRKQSTVRRQGRSMVELREDSKYTTGRTQQPCSYLLDRKLPPSSPPSSLPSICCTREASCLLSQHPLMLEDPGEGEHGRKERLLEAKLPIHLGSWTFSVYAILLP